MKKFLLGLLAGCILSGMFLFVLFFALVKLGDRKPAVPEDATLVVRLEGEVTEVAPVEFPIPFFESQSSVTVANLYEMFRRAAADNRVKAIVFAPKNASVGWAKMQEIHDAILAFRKSGKPVYAFLRTPGTRDYYMATAADKVFMTQEDVLDVKGLRIEAMFVKDTLSKIGVQMEFEHAGRYKDYGDMFTRSDMSPETREVLNSLLDGLYGILLKTIADGRKLPVERVKQLVDQGPLLADDAKKSGLVDDVLYEDQVFEQVKSKLGQKELHRVQFREYLKSVGPEETGRRVALIAGDGAITRGSGSSDLSSQEGIVSGPFMRLLRQVSNDVSVKGVILRIDSPGGDAIASDEILREIKLLAAKKPLVISMSDTAASGGYYMASLQQPVIAYAATITGSIGVVYGKPNLRGLYDKIGVKKELLTRGANAAIDTDYGPLTDAGRAKLRTIIDSTYHRFVSLVAEARRKSYADVDKLAQGRVWLGTQAKDNGLVDELGGLDKAIEVLRRKANFSPNEKIRLVAYPPRRSVFDRLMQSSTDAAVEAAVGNEIRQAMQSSGVRVPDLKAWMQGGILAVMPYRLDVH